MANWYRDARVRRCQLAPLGCRREAQPTCPRVRGGRVACFGARGVLARLGQVGALRVRLWGRSVVGGCPLLSSWAAKVAVAVATRRRCRPRRRAVLRRRHLYRCCRTRRHLLVFVAQVSSVGVARAVDLATRRGPAPALQTLYQAGTANGTTSRVWLEFRGSQRRLPEISRPPGGRPFVTR